MYCTRCGAELTEQARFCIACGAPVDNDIQEKCTVIEEKKTQDREANEPERGASDSDAEATTESSAVRNASFTEALDSSKKKSKQRIPFVVLVALALALLSGIAYAAYQVYTHYIAPTQRAETIELINEAQSDEALDQGADSVENAMKAYEGILEEYRTALYTFLQDANYYDDEEHRKEIPHVNLGALSDYEMLSVTNGGPGNVDEYNPYSGYVYTFIGYAYKDLNEDDVPELLIIYCMGTDPGDPTKALPYPDHAVGVYIFDLYTFENGEPTRFSFEEGALEHVAEFNDEETYGVIVLQDDIEESNASHGAISGDGTFALRGDSYGSDAHFTFEKGSSVLRLYCIVQQAIGNFGGEGTITYADGSTETFSMVYPQETNALEDLEIFALR